MGATSSAIERSQQITTSSTQPHTLEVEFSWKNFNISIISEDTTSPSKPLYIIGFKTLQSQLLFKSAISSTIIGTGSLHPISIDAECSIRGQDINLIAEKRFKIEYEYISTTFSNPDSESGRGGGEPVPMTWVCDTGLKTWEFVCLDAKQIPLARFQANIWAAKKIRMIELEGKATEEDFRDEVVITGLTLFYLTVLRTGNIFSLIGAVFSMPGKNGEKEKTKRNEDCVGEDREVEGKGI
jgi:hypothetical protein